MSSDLQLIVRPARTYAALSRTRVSLGPVRALRRPLIVAMVMAGSAALAGTRHATPALFLSTLACWSAVVAVQLAAALCVIAGPARRAVGVPRALDLFFASHAPWSLWMLAAALWAPVPGVRSLLPLLLAALIPMLLTPRIIAAFFREVLALDRRRAVVRTIVHQAITWAAFVLGYGYAVAVVPRIVQAIG